MTKKLLIALMTLGIVCNVDGYAVKKWTKYDSIAYQENQKNKKGRDKDEKLDTENRISKLEKQLQEKDRQIAELNEKIEKFPKPRRRKRYVHKTVVVKDSSTQTAPSGVLLTSGVRKKVSVGTQTTNNRRGRIRYARQNRNLRLPRNPAANVAVQTD